MAEIELGIVQERFADIVWENEPIGSGDLVKICEETLNWKKPTTYTVLRKLCEKGLLKNIFSRVYYLSRSRQFSLPNHSNQIPNHDPTKHQIPRHQNLL